MTTAKLDQTTGQECVTEACLRDSAVTKDKVANNAIDATKLANLKDKEDEKNNL